ncbi:MAG: hypothetical protein NTZ01_07615 [Verrucomicrobia bacterium]|nr:hypothetical protein [Verrucomicrobiota bacterium]
MKKYLGLLIFVVWWGSLGWAAEADLGGLWKNTAMGIGQSAIIVSQEGADLHVAGYGVWAGGGAGVWHGKGKIEGARVKLPLNYTKLPKPGFDPKVELDLEISADAKTLSGTWKNSLDRKGPVKFVKVLAQAAPKVATPAEVPAAEGPATETDKKEESATP